MRVWYDGRMNICILDDCQKKVNARGLCSTHYDRHQKNGTLEETALPRKYQHYLTDVNATEKTAICGTCGPTALLSNGIDRFGRPAFSCKTRQQENNRRRTVYTFGDGDTIPYSEALEARLRLHTEQNGLCAICKLPEASDRSLSLDHCHETGKIRGLLCNACNVGLGSFRDSPENLIAASEYLTR